MVTGIGRDDCCSLCVTAFIEELNIYPGEEQIHNRMRTAGKSTANT